MKFLGKSDRNTVGNNNTRFLVEETRIRKQEHHVGFYKNLSIIVHSILDSRFLVEEKRIRKQKHHVGFYKNLVININI